mgnify:CR=1 FL=1
MSEFDDYINFKVKAFEEMGLSKEEILKSLNKDLEMLKKVERSQKRCLILALLTIPFVIIFFIV